MIELTERQKARMRKFIAALRSGKYKQGKGRLRNDNEFCCLGVACEVFRTTTKRGFKWEGDNFLGKFQFPPNEVQDYFGFGELNPTLSSGARHIKATFANDDNLWNFSRIADAFEETYLPGDAKKPVTRKKKMSK